MGKYVCVFLADVVILQQPHFRSVELCCLWLVVVYNWHTGHEIQPTANKVPYLKRAQGSRADPGPR